MLALTIGLLPFCQAVVLLGRHQIWLSSEVVETTESLELLIGALSLAAIHLLNKENGERRNTDVRLRVSEDAFPIDVTERQRAEESQALLASIVESSDDSIIGRSLDGVILTWNRGAERLYGYTAAEAIGKPVTMLIPPDGHHVVLEASERLRRSENIERFEAVGLRKGGTQVDLSVIISPIRNTLGQVTGASFISRDITKRKRADAELLRAKEGAEVANRLKSQFLANISHEIRTPMNAITVMTDLVLETELKGEQREYLKTVKSSCETLLTVISDILDLSKIEVGKLELSSGDFRLREGLEETVNLLAPLADRKGLNLMSEVSANVPELVRGDETRLRQVITNLIGNAIKFSERGDIVLRIEMDAEYEQTLLHFVVEDAGIGIPQEKQRLIFDAFSQADGSITRKFGGTGLGLTISAKLVEMMGGRIWVESELGRGSKFHFTMPSAKGNSYEALLAATEEPLADSIHLARRQQAGVIT